MGYPILLNIKNKKCLVVGGGWVAERKIKELNNEGALIDIVSPVISDNLKKMINTSSNIRYYNKEVEPKDLNNKFLVIAATNSNTLNEMICYKAQKKGILTNNVSSRKNADFMNMSKIDVNNMIIALSSNGINPEKTKHLKQLVAGALKCL